MNVSVLAADGSAFGSPFLAGMEPDANTATLAPGLMNPATRAGSVSCTETAIIPSGMVMACSVPGAPNFAGMICSFG